MAKNNETVTFYSLTGPAQTLQAMIPNLPMLQQGGWQGGTTQAGSSLSETSTISRGRGGTRGGTKAQHAKAGHLGGLATGAKRGRKPRSPNTETSGATS